MKEIRILIVDDHPVVSEGLTTILSYKDQDIDVVGTAADGAEAIRMYETHKPDIILMDIKMPHCDGIEATREILKQDPMARILMLTTFDDVELINDALDAGAKGYLMKDSKSDQILQAIRSVAEGNILMSSHVADVMRDEKKDKLEKVDNVNRERLSSLAFRHKEILILMADGLSNNEIGEALYISEKTVRNYVDGMKIDSPEAVIEHLEKHAFPQLRRQIEQFDEDSRVKDIIEIEAGIQRKLGPDILKGGYRFIHFPYLSYPIYGYENYFMAYALYPEVVGKAFSLQADLALLNNHAAARAYQQGNLAPIYRLDHDMADSRGTLVSIKSLDKLWFPHFARALEPMLRTEVKLIWHCDGNLMEMVPRLLDVGIAGFQGFQYEDGMDYEKICRMKTVTGNDLIIVAGVSVTRTLPNGTPDDVRNEMKWLVENGPKTGLFLAGSSSIAPGVPWENIEAFVEGLKYYREHGRG